MGEKQNTHSLVFVVSTLLLIQTYIPTFASEGDYMSGKKSASSIDATDLLAMREQLETQWSMDYLNGPPLEAKQFDFLLGNWEMTRRAFDLNGAVASESKGEMHARYLLDGRVIQEEYHSFLPDGRIFRGGVGLYTYVPSTKQWVTASADAVVGVNNSAVQKDGDEYHYENTFEIQGTTVFLRGRWYDIKQDEVSWVGTGSVDGQSWFKTYEVHMVRMKAE